MGEDYLFEVKKIEIWVPAFFKHNNSSVATEFMEQEAKYIKYVGAEMNLKKGFTYFSH